MSQKISIKKGNIQETLLLPLWGRAYETQKDKPRLIDKKAVEIIDRLDYDFSTIEKTQSMSQHGWVARSLHTDRMALKFMMTLRLSISDADWTPPSAELITAKSCFTRLICRT